MLRATLNEIADMLGLTGEYANVYCEGVSTDSRSIAQGNLFVALNGPHYRGVDFVSAAQASGASAAIVDRLQPGTFPQLLVADTRASLQRLATAWRALMTPMLVGITGSNGKTTMRSMVAACFGANTLATQGNLNNDIGVPLTLLRLSAEDRYAVVEMGANHAGEIAALAQMAVPHIGIVTNAGPAHLEGFGSLQGVADGKGELFSALGDGDTAVINADDVFYDQWCEMAAPARVLSFGSTARADVWFDGLDVSDGVRFTVHCDNATAPVTLQLSGAHNAHNACGAIAVGVAAGISLNAMVTALGAVKPEPGRQKVVRGVHGGALIDDTYNANPASMCAAARAAVANHESVTMIIGDMGELGDDSASLHAELGRTLRDIGVSRLITFGELAAHAAEGFGVDAHVCTTLDATLVAARQNLANTSAVLVKGSRSMRMERIVDALADTTEEAC
ncbi:MAG: UDP-N-acetylmuramoyl-tripeptide--D-alanyl-D-alanine ligase [Pseudomonadota bacterium]